MQIEEITKSETVPFKEIRTGECFRIIKTCDIYMKVHYETDDTVSCVNMKTGVHHPKTAAGFPKDDEEVYPVKAKLTVTN